MPGRKEVHIDLIRDLAEKAKWVKSQRQDTPWGLAIHIACQGDVELKAQVGRLLGTRGAMEAELNRRRQAKRLAGRKGQQVFAFLSAPSGKTKAGKAGA